jgi:UDP-glucose:(heptosyl)LPS alpha-1,3-glucosyltransferase
MSRPRVAVVSPFIDKRHGTERHLAEWLPRLANRYEIHLYSQRVEDMDLSNIVFHPIPRIPGPHLFNYLWLFAANHFCRWRDRRFRGLIYDLLFTPGINCLDADVISVHVVFADLYSKTRNNLSLRLKNFWSWPTMIHRWVYYQLAIQLERQIYVRPDTSIIAISQKTASDLKRFYGRNDDSPVECAGIDHRIFNPSAIANRRSSARAHIGLPDSAFVLLLVGNDWYTKGLDALLETLYLLKDLPIHLLVVGKDESKPFQGRILAYGLADKIHFLPPMQDVVAYYAAADAYAGPSLGEAFALPPAEMMACGLPIIASAEAGVSAIITHGSDGLVLNDPSDVEELAMLVKQLYHNPELRLRLGEAATKTMRQHTWDQSVASLGDVFRETLARKNKEKVTAKAFSPA